MSVKKQWLIFVNNNSETLLQWCNCSPPNKETSMAKEQHVHLDKTWALWKCHAPDLRQPCSPGAGQTAPPRPGCTCIGLLGCFLWIPQRQRERELRFGTCLSLCSNCHSDWFLLLPSLTKFSKVFWMLRLNPTIVERASVRVLIFWKEKPTHSMNFNGGTVCFNGHETVMSCWGLRHHCA